MKTYKGSIVVVCLSLAFALARATVLAQAPPTPGPEHEVLKKMEGNWNAKVKMGEDESKATAVYKMEMGGLWLVGTFSGQFFEQKFEGRGMDTWDPEKKKYVSVWADSFSTRPMFLEGTYDKEKKTLTMTGEAPGPDGKMARHRMVTHFVNDDRHKFTMYITGADGEEAEMMTIEYTRKK